MMPNKTIEQFRTRRDLWIECFNGNDPHSIMNQICRMVWNTAAFQVINEARRLARPAEENTVQLSGLIHELIDEGFFEGQLLAIRRLTDTYPITDDSRGRDVWSLTSLLDDMRNHVHLMTRGKLPCGGRARIRRCRCGLPSKGVPSTGTAEG